MSERTINTIWIKVSGKLNIQETYELGDVVDCVLRGEIVKKEIKDNMDGTVDITYILKPTETYEFKKKKL